MRAGSLTIAADGKVTAADLGNDIGIEVAPANGSNATLNVEPGATLQTQRLILGGNTANNSGGSATLNQTGGTIHSGQWLAVGSAGTGTSVMNLSGGILNVNGSGGTHMEVAVFGAANGVVNVSGSAEIHVLNNGNLQMGQAANGSGNGTINQTGGTVTFHSDGGMTPGGIGGLRLGNGTGRTGTYTYNLAGGSLTVPVITRNSGTAVFNFDGGTLRAADSNPTFLSGLIATHIKGGGAMVDSNGFDVTIATTLAHDATLGAAPDGGLVKQGAGTLTLSGANSYTGATVVEAGTLLLSGGISGSRSIQVKQDATLDVSTVAGGFFLVGGQTLAGSGLVSGSLGMNANSRLAPGDGIGTLAFANNLTISLAVTPVASSALQFQLGGPEASDRITLASGTLTIGNGVLGLDDLALLPQQGFGAGTYLLVDGTVPITGFLDLNAANLNGNIQGFEANLALADGGNDLVLVVVPEPGSMGLLAAAGLLLGLRRYRRNQFMAKGLKNVIHPYGKGF